MRDDRRPAPARSATLSEAQPDCPYARLALFAMRRMAVGGLEDAYAAHALFTGFGAGFRRPLVLLRALMAEIARVSSVRVAVAPCCCPRVTPAEDGLLTALLCAIDRPERAHRALCGTLHVRTCLGLVTSAQAVAQAFADHGMPLAAIRD